MLFRFCHFCHKHVSVSNINLRKYAKSATVIRSRKREVKDETPIVKKKETPIITCRQPALIFYKGQTYSKFEPIPLATKGWNHTKAKGDHIFIFPEKKSIQNESIQEPSFEKFNLQPALYDRLQDIGLLQPLEIQEKAIDKILDGQNTVLAAETGCGKTLAYLIPVINQVLKLKQLSERHLNSPLAMIITPSRELAVQIGLEAKKLGTNLGVSTKIVTGGRTKRMALNLPMSYVDILVGSFGVVSKLTTMQIYKLDRVQHIVLDEADALFHETFEGKLKVFLHRLPIGYKQVYDSRGIPKNTQLTLASATIPRRVTEILGDIVNMDSLVNVVSEKLHHILVLQKFVRLGPSQKPYELLKFVKPKVKNRQSVIIFSNTNSTCDWISMFLHECNVNNVNLNGAMPLVIRQGKYAEFVKGEVQVLTTTNIGSRGLDTLMVKHILNYDFPLDTADYIHRCGRIGRVGSKRDCRVTNFISRPLEIKLVQIIERAIRKGKPIPIVDLLKQGIKEEPEDDSAITFDEMSQSVIENLDKQDSIPF